MTAARSAALSLAALLAALLAIPVAAEDAAKIFPRSCAPCHGKVGDGKGITTKYNMVAVANFHDLRLVSMADGEIFNTITHGKNLMGSYGANVEIEDRWAIIAYIRALQESARKAAPAEAAAPPAN